MSYQKWNWYDGDWWKPLPQSAMSLHRSHGKCLLLVQRGQMLIWQTHRGKGQVHQADLFLSILLTSCWKQQQQQQSESVESELKCKAPSEPSPVSIVKIAILQLCSSSSPTPPWDNHGQRNEAEKPKSGLGDNDANPELFRLPSQWKKPEGQGRSPLTWEGQGWLTALDFFVLLFLIKLFPLGCGVTVVLTWNPWLQTEVFSIPLPQGLLTNLYGSLLKSCVALFMGFKCGVCLKERINLGIT